MLCRPGETCTDHTLCKHLDWNGLCTTFHNVCKKCPTCQRAKPTIQKYGKLPPKKGDKNPWDTLCVELFALDIEKMLVIPVSLYKTVP